jgi:hypothetical protein
MLEMYYYVQEIILRQNITIGREGGISFNNFLNESL